MRQVHMDKLQVYIRNPASEYVSNQFNMTGTGNLLVNTPYKNMNSLASYHFLGRLGEYDSVFNLVESDQDQKHDTKLQKNTTYLRPV